MEACPTGPSHTREIVAAQFAGHVTRGLPIAPSQQARMARPTTALVARRLHPASRVPRSQQKARAVDGRERPHPRACVPNGYRGHRLKARRLAVSVWPVDRLGEDQVRAKRHVRGRSVRRREAWARPQPGHLAWPKGAGLVYAGSVEIGIDDATVREPFGLLEPLRRPRSPLSAPVKGAKPKWVEPRMLVEIAFPNVSEAGCLRHPKFKGVREDD